SRYSANDRFTDLTVPRALSRIHRITKFTFKKGRQSSHGVKLIPPNVTRILITEGVAAGLSLKRMVNLTTRCPQRGKNNPAILTAAPFRGLPQPEAHGRIKFNDGSKGEGLRRALSCYALTFQGYILLVNCQCRILICVRRTTTRSSVSIFNSALNGG
ncbi:hypothetical protein ACPX4I_005530, partial [Escherichia coli]